MSSALRLVVTEEEVSGRTREVHAHEAHGREAPEQHRQDNARQKAQALEEVLRFAEIEDHDLDDVEEFFNQYWGWPEQALYRALESHKRRGTIDYTDLRRWAYKRLKGTERRPAVPRHHLIYAAFCLKERAFSGTPKRVLNYRLDDIAQLARQALPSQASPSNAETPAPPSSSPRKNQKPSRVVGERLVGKPNRPPAYQPPWADD